ncbi:TIGR02677 family protein [Crassaminicella indica]|uniref:TIGR02677 family protein n=1 Tax=Crassaminicella indica TaxID=2855394 RepID=A0ABX8RCP8_9CLOT|nr:TIGR02677 family protein [Crassaminicella indica]QXM06571.1 TIGR02677 family protein [Crassaminicella indica]
MKLDISVKAQIDEAKYLATENTWRYRAIIRCMYKCYEKMKYWLYKEEIYEILKKYEEFADYSEDYLKNDLDSLVSWKNLIAVADTTKVRTVDEFKNRAFRYQLSPYTIEIERMLMKLENMTVENNASLECTLVERFRELLERYDSIALKEDKEVYEWWKLLNKSFKELNQNYQDYISRFYSPKTEELMKTTEFLMFKESFIIYLRDFIRGLQLNSVLIKKLLKDISDDAIKKIIDKVLAHEKTIPNINTNIKEDEFIEIHQGRFRSIKDWFFTHKGKEPLIEQLIDNTNHIIRKITRFASQLADKRNNSANRKEEYRKIAKLFSECKDMEEANKLSSLVFGVFNTKHIKGDETRVTESINSSIYDEVPTKVITKPRVRTYREKIIKNPIIDKRAKKEERLKKILKKRKMEKELMERFILNDQIDFAKLPKLTQKDRVVLLRWLSKGKGSKKGLGKTEFGREYSVTKYDCQECIKIKCEDGIFTMPHYVIKFKKEE